MYSMCDMISVHNAECEGVFDDLSYYVLTGEYVRVRRELDGGEIYIEPYYTESQEHHYNHQQV